MNAAESACPSHVAHGDAHASGVATGATRHLASLDILRACAALMVFIYHCQTEFGFAAHSPYAPTVTQGHFGVHLFYALSGYLIYATLDREWKTASPTQSRWDWAWRFWVKRLFRIYPLYLACIAIVLALSTPIRNSMTAGNLLSHILGVHSWFRPHHGAINGVMWTLSIEIQFYALAPFLYLLARRMSDRALIASTLAVWAVSYMTVRYELIDRLGFWSNQGPPDSWSYFMGLTQLPSVLPLFVIGCLAYRRSSRAPSCLGPILAVVVFAALPYALQKLRPARIDPVLLNYVWGLLTGCCFLPLLTNAAATTVKGTVLARFMWWISDISYSFYMWHLLVIRLVANFFPGQSMGFKLCVSFWTAAIVADFTRRYIERPGIEVGRRLLERRKTVLYESGCMR